MAFRALLVSGSLRAQSTNAAALRTLVAHMPPGLSGSLYDDLASLPAFNPDCDGTALPAAVSDLRGRIHDSDALVVSTPEYAGALPGSFKNLLDWTIGDAGAGSIYQKPVAWVNVSPRGATGAHTELRTVLDYAHAAIVEEACIYAPVTQGMVGADGLISDPATLGLLGPMAQALFDALAPSDA